MPSTTSEELFAHNFPNGVRTIRNCRTNSSSGNLNYPSCAYPKNLAKTAILDEPEKSDPHAHRDRGVLLLCSSFFYFIDDTHGYKPVDTSVAIDQINDDDVKSAQIDDRERRCGSS